MSVLQTALSSFVLLREVIISSTLELGYSSTPLSTGSNSSNLLSPLHKKTPAIPPNLPPPISLNRPNPKAKADGNAKSEHRNGIKNSPHDGDVITIFPFEGKSSILKP